MYYGIILREEERMEMCSWMDLILCGFQNFSIIDHETFVANAVTMTGENCSTNLLLAKLTSTLIVGYASHRLNLKFKILTKTMMQ